MRRFKPMLTIFSLICLVQFVKANTGEKGKKSTEGAVHGYIWDAETRKPIGGVTISLSSAKLAGEKEIQSDASGYFNFGKLPAGEVTIMFEKKGYKLYKKGVLPLKEGTTVKMSVEVQPDNEDDNVDILHPLFKLLNEK